MSKKINLLFVMLLTTICTHAQYNLSADGANQIKSKSLIVILPGETTIASMLRGAFEKKWTMHKTVEFKTDEEAKKMMTASPKKYVKIILGIETASEVTKMEQYWGKDMVIANNKLGEIPKFYIYNDGKKPIHALGLPSNCTFSEITLMEAINRLQFTINEIEADGSWLKAFNQTKDKYLSEVKTRKLLIPKDVVADDKTMEEIKTVYKYDLEFVSPETIEKYIIEGNNKFSYVVIVEETVNVHVQYICNTEDVKFLGHYHTMIQSAKTFKEGQRNLYLETDGFKKLIKSLN